MINIRWSNGEEYKKSYKSDKPVLNSKNEIITNTILRGEQIDKKKNISIENNNTSEELFERNLVTQTYINPFLNKSYNDVLIDQEKYMIPKISYLSK